MGHRSAALLAIVLLAALASGCGTSRFSDTSRTGLEQLLISTAVDRSLDMMDFSGLAGQAVYVEQKYLDCVDKNYIVAAIRHRALKAGARLVDKPDQADLVLEVRSGAVGTDRAEAFVGVPGVTLPPPVSVAIPDLKLATRTSQTGTAKVGIAVLDAKTGKTVGEGGTGLARAIDSNWSFLGIGPFNTGNVRYEIDNAKEMLVSHLGFDLASREPPRPEIGLPDTPSDDPVYLPQPLLAAPPPSGLLGEENWLR